MIYLLMLILALILMLPLAFAFRAGPRLQNRRDAAMALHQAQLMELARDLADHRIAASEYAAARLEVERRLLAADALAEAAPDGNAKYLLVAAAIAVPVMAFAFYLPGSTPTVPSEPHTQWVAREAAQNQKIDGLIAALREKLSELDPNSAAASQGQAYLAETLAEQARQITPESLALFKQSLVNAPPDASWRELAQQRVAQASAP